VANKALPKILAIYRVGGCCKVSPWNEVINIIPVKGIESCQLMILPYVLLDSDGSYRFC
jgi:hypothetical protein